MSEPTKCPIKTRNNIIVRNSPDDIWSPAWEVTECYAIGDKIFFVTDHGTFEFDKQVEKGSSKYYGENGKEALLLPWSLV